MKSKKVPIEKNEVPMMGTIQWIDVREVQPNQNLMHEC